MKARLLIIVGMIILGIVVASTMGIREYQSAYNQDCISKDGKMVGFLRCVKTHEDFGLPNPFTVDLEFGETFHHEGLEIRFFEIEDSRCPLDVTCVWEGNVTAMFKISNQTSDISTGGMPIGFTVDFVSPYEITLKDIAPHPVSTEKPDYVATLEIKKTEHPTDKREELRKVAYSNTDCAKLWRGELFEMWDDVNHDYKNDPIFIECLKALTSQRHLANLEFDKWSGAGDIHYDRVDRDKKYWATLKDVKLRDDDGESISVTFSGNGFETRWMTAEKQEKTYSVPDFRYVTTVHKGQEFVALCTDMVERRIHVLKYDGIVEKEGVSYYSFWHKSTTIPIEGLPKCEYPTIIHDSLSIDFDLGDKPTSPVWDHDWE